MALTVPPMVIATPPLAGWLIVGGLVLYGGGQLIGDVRRLLGAGPPDGEDGGPLVTLPLALVALGVGLALLSLRR